MGASAKGMLYGVVTPAEIGAALHRAGYRTELIGTDHDLTRLTVFSPGGVERRVLSVFGKETSMLDHEDLHPGESTAVALGANGCGPDIVRVLAEEFGGFHKPRDDDEWIPTAGKRAVSLTPVEALHAAFHRFFPGHLATAATIASITDPKGLVEVRDAIDAYVESLGPSPAP